MPKYSPATLIASEEVNYVVLRWGHHPGVVGDVDFFLAVGRFVKESEARALKVLRELYEAERRVQSDVYSEEAFEQSRQAAENLRAFCVQEFGEAEQEATEETEG